MLVSATKTTLKSISIILQSVKQAVHMVCGSNDPFTSRITVLNSGRELIFWRVKMEPQDQNEEENVEKIAGLNTIFEDLITDASDLVKDLNWGVKTYMFFGLITMLFGIQEIVYNIDVVQERFYIPMFVGGVLIFSGFVQILNYFRLRSKYSKLFRVQSELKKS